MLHDVITSRQSAIEVNLIKITESLEQDLQLFVFTVVYIEYHLFYIRRFYLGLLNIKYAWYRGRVTANLTNIIN